MNKSDLIEALSKSEDLTRTKAEEVVNLVFSEMTNALVAGDRVEIRGLGSFKVKSYDGYKGRNPKTGKQRVKSRLKSSPKSPKSQSRFPQPQLSWPLSKEAGKVLMLPL